VGVDAVATRFLALPGSGLGGRVAIWRDTLTIIRDFPWTGSGLNSYGTAMLYYQTFGFPAYFPWAHNDYLQLAAEGAQPRSRSEFRQEDNPLLAARRRGWASCRNSDRDLGCARRPTDTFASSREHGLDELRDSRWRRDWSRRYRLAGVCRFQPSTSGQRCAVFRPMRVSRCALAAGVRPASAARQVIAGR